MGTKKSTMNPTSGTTTPPIACTIAGTDSGGSAGLAADLETFAAHHVHGVFAVTVVTAQNTTGIQSVHALPTSFVGDQVDALVSDMSIGATKTGLLFSRDVLEEVVERIADLGVLIVDPVLVTSAGRPMLGNEMPAGYIELLFPHAAVVTPNVAEAELLTGLSISSPDDAEVAARSLVEFGPETAVITGLFDDGHAIDTIATADRVWTHTHDKIPTNNVLGTGCTLSAAITARMASGWDVADAVDAAIDYVHDGIASGASWRIGAGRGPIDHFVDVARIEDRRV